MIFLLKGKIYKIHPHDSPVFWHQRIDCCFLSNFSDDKDSDGKEKKSKSKEKEKKKEPASMFQINGEKETKSKKKGDAQQFHSSHFTGCETLHVV